MIYLRQEGRGVGLLNKLAAYSLQDKGLDTIEANLALGLPVDDRHYGLAARIIEKFAPQSVHLMTNNPHKLSALQAALSIDVHRVPMTSRRTPFNQDYLKTKIEKLHHPIQFV